MRRKLLVLLPLIGMVDCDGCNSKKECTTHAATLSPAGNWTIEGSGERVGCSSPNFNGKFELGPSIPLAVEAAGETTDGHVPADRGMSDVRPSLDQRAAPQDAAASDRGNPDARSAPDRVSPGDGLSLTDRGPGSDADGRARPDGLSRPDLRPPLDLFVRLDTRPPTGAIPFRLKGQIPGFSLTGQVQGNCVTFQTQESTTEGTLSYSFTGSMQKDDGERTISGSFNGSGPAGCTAAGDFTVTIR